MSIILYAVFMGNEVDLDTRFTGDSSQALAYGGVVMGEKKEEKTGLEIDCYMCGERITEPGALVFSPPDGMETTKYHICKDCWPSVMYMMDKR